MCSMSCIDINDGEAHIKPEYILPKEASGEKKEEESGASEGADSTSEPPQKKQKFTGRNKKRPKLVKVPKSSKLCRQLWCLRVGEDPKTKCTYPNCVFSHDVATFLNNKGEDRGTECHNFRTYGMCPYGLMCSFGSDHIEGTGNKVNEELWDKFKNKPPVTNTLKKEVQQLLWKRKYDFTKAMQAHRAAQSEMSKQKAEEEKAKKKEAENSVAKKEDLRQEECEEEKENSCISEEATSKIGEAELATQDMSVEESEKTKAIGPAPEEDLIKLTSREKKKIDWRDKLYLAPLTTLGNLPFRRICKRLGADITCGEMALSVNLLQGSASEWALVKRHESEDVYGIQLCGSNAEAMIKCAELLDREIGVDFIDINMGCPIDLVYKQGGGSALMRRQSCLEHMVRGMTKVMSIPLTLKMRTGVYRDASVAHSIIEKAKLWDVSMVTLHGRSKEQRYLKLADWKYIKECAVVADPMPLYGNGDIFTYEDYKYQKENSGVAGVMIGRGALIKPWIFKEIKEEKHWDITSSERFDILKEYVNYGLEHWGSDNEGIEKTRRFLLEWLSFLHRYIPVGVLEQTQKINQRPPLYRGRDHLETLMISKSAKDWIKISEMLLGPTPPDFEFLPKHKANAYG